MSQARDLADLGSSAEAGTVTGENLLINGSYNVFQRSTSATGVTTDTYAAPDRWKTRVIDTSEFTISQSTDVPSGEGFTYSCKWDCTTANASPAATAFIDHEQRIEAQDLQHLEYGTSFAKKLTVSFWVKSSKTGVHTYGLYQADGTRSNMTSYNITTANTWQKVTHTFDGDTAGTINADTGEGLRLWFILGAGSNFSSGTQQSGWAAYLQSQVLATNSVNLADSTDNEWYITGCKLEVGSTSTPIKQESYGETLAKCHRYFRKSEHLSGAGYQSFGTATAFGTTSASGSLYYGHMRTNPTLAQSGGNLYGAGGNHAISALSTSYFGTERAFVNITSSSLTSGYGYNWCGNNNTGAYVTMDAEL